MAYKQPVSFLMALMVQDQDKADKMSGEQILPGSQLAIFMGLRMIEEMGELSRVSFKRMLIPLVRALS
jgi:hypothetical protein